MWDYYLIKGEVKEFTFTFDVDIAAATFTLVCENSSGVVQFTKNDGDFDKTEIADKIVKITIDTSTLSIGVYYMELKTVWSAANIDKTKQYTFKVTESLST